MSFEWSEDRRPSGVWGRKGIWISGTRPQHSPDPTLSLFHPYPQNYSSIRVKHNLFLANAEHIASIAPLPTLKWKEEGEGCGKKNFTLHNCGTCHFCWCQTFPAISKASLVWIVFGKIESRGNWMYKEGENFLFRRNENVNYSFEKQILICLSAS